MDFWTIFFLIVGLIVLIKSADFFVDSAVKIAEMSGIPKLIIGATIVSLATTLPELFVSSSSVLAGSNRLAVSNALGSVIFNTSVILSIAAIYMSGKVDRKNIMEKAIILILSLSTLTLFSLIDLRISLFEGIIQFVFIIVYTYLNVIGAKKQKEVREVSEHGNNKREIVIHLLILLGSAVGIFIGSQLLVRNAETIAEYAGISQEVIGITILAIGTSLPELTTTVTSVLKKQQSLSVGNVLGANILNVTLVLGTCGILGNFGKDKGLLFETREMWPFTGDIPQALYIDLPVVFIIILLFVIPIAITGQIKKWQGFTGLAIYIAYITYLLFNAS